MFKISPSKSAVLKNDVPNTSYTWALKNAHITEWLAKCSRDVYDSSKSYELFQAHELFEGSDIVVGKFERGHDQDILDDMVCIAIRGTTTATQWGHNVHILANPVNLLPLIDAIVSKLTTDPDFNGERDRRRFITGHSQGGFVAEAVASKMGLDGVAFMSPGVPPTVRGSLIGRFEVHIHEKDVVSMGRPEEHVACPVLHSYPLTDEDKTTLEQAHFLHKMHDHLVHLAKMQRESGSRPHTSERYEPCGCEITNR